MPGAEAGKKLVNHDSLTKRLFPHCSSHRHPHLPSLSLCTPAPVPLHVPELLFLSLLPALDWRSVTSARPSLPSVLLSWHRAWHTI